LNILVSPDVSRTFHAQQSAELQAHTAENGDSQAFCRILNVFGATLMVSSMFLDSLGATMMLAAICSVV